MKKQRKLLLKKVNIATMNHLHIIKGGVGDDTYDPNNTCVSLETDPRTDCIVTTADEKTCPAQDTFPTATTRGNGSI